MGVSRWVEAPGCLVQVPQATECLPTSTLLTTRMRALSLLAHPCAHLCSWLLQNIVLAIVAESYEEAKVGLGL